MAFPVQHLVDDFKASSIVLTGAFGVLGLVKDFKDKKGKITKWGRISLAGILLSTGLGVITQLMDSSAAAQKEADTAKQTLRIVQDIQRGLSPLDEPVIGIDLSLDCTNLAYGEFCDKIKSKPDGLTLPEIGKLWDYWPGGGTRISLFLEVNFFVNPKDADLYLEGKKTSRRSMVHDETNQPRRVAFIQSL